MAHVFLSYSHKDTTFVSKLAKSLKERDIDVWMDDEIDYGDRYPRVIEAHLDGCEAVVLVMSEHSKQSEWVGNELVYAKNKGKAVLPLLLDGDPWLEVAAIQHADVSNRELPPNDFYERLDRVIARGPSVPLTSGVPQDAGRSKPADVWIKAAFAAGWVKGNPQYWLQLSADSPEWGDFWTAVEAGARRT